MAGVAQGAVDGFDVVLMTGQDDHRHGALFGQSDSPSAVSVLMQAAECAWQQRPVSSSAI